VALNTSTHIPFQKNHQESRPVPLINNGLLRHYRIMVTMMKMLKAIFVLLLFFSLNPSCGSVKPKIQNETTEVKNEVPQIRSVDLTIISKFRENKIKLFGEWDIGEELPLFYVVQKKDDGENGDQLLIQDSDGKVLYEKGDIDVESVYRSSALRIIRDQLVFEYGEGGSDSYVQMLDFDGGKVSEIIDSAKGANSFGADIRIQPQFRSGVNPAKEPFEILLTDYGLASPAGQFTSVLRYKDKKYRYFGRFDREKAGNCKENIITQ